MFKQIFRLTFFTFIWKKYKRIIVSTASLFVFFWFVNFAHAEYLSFAKFQSQESQVTLSFYIKWLCLAIGVIAYLIYMFVGRGKKAEGIKKPLRKKQESNEKLEDAGLDPFDAIRHKENLRTRAEIMLDGAADRGKKN